MNSDCWIQGCAGQCIEERGRVLFSARRRRTRQHGAPTPEAAAGAHRRAGRRERQAVGERETHRESWAEALLTHVTNLDSFFLPHTLLSLPREWRALAVGARARAAVFFERDHLKTSAHIKHKAIPPKRAIRYIVN